MKLDLHYTDPRLVDLYDVDNPRGIDYDFYIQLAKDIKAKTIIDLGCGTGLLTRELASYGWKVTGIDPATTMLAYAQKQPNAHLVQWIEGDSSALGTPSADLVLMTGNVAQVFLEDSDWLITLYHIYDALRPGGYVTFESRNPEAREWESWKPESSCERIQTAHGEMECWVELVSVQDSKVHFQGHNVFTKTGEVLIVDSTLRFRTEQEIRNSLEQVGFQVCHVYGGWHHEPLSSKSRVMVFVAQHPKLDSFSVSNNYCTDNDYSDLGSLESKP